MKRWVGAASVVCTCIEQTADRPSSGGGLDPVVSLSQLTVQLGVSVQTLYDLRNQARGPGVPRRP